MGTSPQEVYYRYEQQRRREQAEADRQREADRLASEANPPIRIPIPPEGCTVVPRRLNVTETVYCIRGTAFCTLKHDGTDPPEPTYAERLKASNERVKAGETKHELQD